MATSGVARHLAALRHGGREKTMTKIAIMGTGMVGSAMQRFFQSQNMEVGVYDPPKGLADTSVLAEADVLFIAVPTPYYLDGTGFDDSFIKAAIEAIPVPGKTIVLKSTILPGTTDRFQAEYPQHRFLFNPEFLTETTVDQDMQKPNRQMIGYTKQSRRDAELVLGILPRAPFEKIIPAQEAELVKYFGNAFYALKVAYANQMFDLCDAMGADYDRVKDCVKAEPWMGVHHWEIFHKGYRGYGGKCLPKDTRAIIQHAERKGIDLSLLKQAEAYNNELAKGQGLDVQWPEGSPKKN
jgi:UDPglucose 6-dehydrogenase